MHSTSQVGVDTLGNLDCVVQVLHDLILITYVSPAVSVLDYERLLNTVFTMQQSLYNRWLSRSEIRLEPCSDLLTLSITASVMQAFGRTAALRHDSSNSLITAKRNLNTDLIRHILDALSTFDTIRPSDYHSILSQIQSFDIRHIPISAPLLLLHDMSHRYETFGKYSDEIYRQKWKAISFCLELLSADPVASRPSVAILPALTRSLLLAGMNQLDLCSKDAVTNILLVFRRLVMYAAAITPPASSHVDCPSSLDSVAVVKDMLECSWEVCFNTDNLMYLHMKLFILICFERDTLAILDQADQQVVALTSTTYLSIY
jgi:hypothetical protein